jgi:hypothetical protein
MPVFPSRVYQVSEHVWLDAALDAAMPLECHLIVNCLSVLCRNTDQSEECSYEIVSERALAKDEVSGIGA